MSQKPILLCDVDHVLADATWRDPHLGDWETYHNLAKFDAPHLSTIRLVTTACRFGGWLLVLLTCRNERYRFLTHEWCINNAVYYDELIMRPDDDFRPSREVKIDLARRRFGDDLVAAGVVAFFEDREDVLAPFRMAGIPCHQVHHGVRSEEYERWIRKSI